MKLPTIPASWVIAGVAVAGAVIWAKTRGASGVGAAIGSAAVDAVDGVVSGTVVGIGQTVGIPATNQTECDKAKAEGRTWDASFACQAGDFLRYVFK